MSDKPDGPEATALAIRFLRDTADILEKREAGDGLVPAVVLFCEEGPIAYVPHGCEEAATEQLERGVTIEGYSRSAPS